MFLQRLTLVVYSLCLVWTAHGFSSTSGAWGVARPSSSWLQATEADVAASTVDKTKAEMVQRSLLQARLDMEQKQRQVKGQAAEIESSFVDDERSPATDDKEMFQRSLLQAQLQQNQLALQKQQLFKSQELAALQKEERESKQVEASAMMRRAQMEADASAQKQNRESKQLKALDMITNDRRKQAAATMKEERESKQQLASVAVENAQRQEAAGKSKENRESKQGQAMTMVANAQRKAEAEAMQSDRESKQEQAFAMIANAQRKAEAEAMQSDRESKQEQAFAMIANAQRKAEAEAAHEDREFKQYEADRLLQKDSSSSGYVMLSRHELDQLTEKYAAIDDLSEKAYQILKDLGSFDWSI